LSVLAAISIRHDAITTLMAHLPSLLRQRQRLVPQHLA